MDSINNERGGAVIPRVSVLSLFKDGGIGIYHIKRKEWIFKREHVSQILNFCIVTKSIDILRKMFKLIIFMYLGSYRNYI